MMAVSSHFHVGVVNALRIMAQGLASEVDPIQVSGIGDV
jgi:hypothetical protein